MSFFVVALHKSWRKKKYLNVILHYVLLIAVTAVMYFVFKIPSGQIRTSFFNTIVGWLCLLVYIIKTDYPATKLNFGFAVFGFIADAAGHFVYLDEDYLTSFLCVTLQIIQLIHVILVYRLLKKERIPILVSPSQFMLDIENGITYRYRQFSTYVNKNILKKELNLHRRKYKKKQKNKKTHRKK